MNEVEHRVGGTFSVQEDENGTRSSTLEKTYCDDHNITKGTEERQYQTQYKGKPALLLVFEPEESDEDDE